jgi:hypothetical protein
MFGNAGRVPSLSAAERGDLLGRYGDDIAALEKLLERDLSVWTAAAEVVS